VVGSVLTVFFKRGASQRVAGVHIVSENKNPTVRHGLVDGAVKAAGCRPKLDADIE